MASNQQTPAEQGIQSISRGIAINIGLAVVKGLGGIAGNSYALIADAVESAADVVTSLVAYWGLRVASRKPDERHPYGHGKAEPLTALFLSFCLTAAAVLIGYQSIENVIQPHKNPEPFTLGILALVVVVKELLFRYQRRIGQAIGSTTVQADAVHQRSDAFTSIAAFIGISIAIIGGDGYESADDYAALFASAFIIYNAYAIFRPALSEIMDEAPPAVLAEQVRDIALNVAGVSGLDKCLIRKMGSYYFVDLHVLVPAQLTVRKGHTIAHEVKDAVRQRMPQVTDVLVHIEPQ